MSKGWKITGIVVAVIVVGLAGFFYWATWEGSPQEITAVADKFKPEPGWKLVTDDVIPPQTICIMGNCPSVFRTWETKKLLTKQEFETQLNRAGWSFAVDGECMPSSNVSGGEGVCDARGIDGHYKVLVEVVGDYGGEETPKVTLSVDDNK